MQKTPTIPTGEILAAPKQPNESQVTQHPAPEAWEEFLEDDADCCGGCNHKPR